MHTQLAMISVQLLRSRNAIDGSWSVFELTTLLSIYLQQCLRVHSCHGISRSISSSSSCASTAAAASTGKLAMLVLGELGSFEDAARLCFELRGDAAGDIGAVGPYLASCGGMDRVSASINNGCTE